MTSSRYLPCFPFLLANPKVQYGIFSHIRGVFTGNIVVRSFVGKYSLKWIFHNVPQCCLLHLPDRVNRDLVYQRPPITLAALVLLDPVMYVVFLPLRAAALLFMSCRAPSITARATPLIYNVTWGCCVGFDSGDTSEWVCKPACWWADVWRMFNFSVASTDTVSVRVHKTALIKYI